jgi:hypothetical protein
VQLVVSDAHEGSAVPGSAQRREQQPMLAALIRPTFNAESGEQARELVGDQNARPHEHHGTAGLARFAGLECLLKRGSSLRCQRIDRLRSVRWDKERSWTCSAATSQRSSWRSLSPPASLSTSRLIGTIPRTSRIRSGFGIS